MTDNSSSGGNGAVEEEKDDRSQSSSGVEPSGGGAGDGSSSDRNRNNEDAQTEHVVWIGRAPPALCVGEEPVRALFSPFGELCSVKIHHDYEDMSAEGFMFLGFASRSAAQRAVDAVTSGTLDSESRYYDTMQARMALRRGGAPVVERDEDTADLLLGRRVASAANAFSQRSMGDDEDDLVLQSLSQSAFGLSSSQSASQRLKKSGKAKKTKKKEQSATGPKRQRRARASSFLSVGDGT